MNVDHKIKLPLINNFASATDLKDQKGTSHSVNRVVSDFREQEMI